jgi:hypothetical protein
MNRTGGKNKEKERKEQIMEYITEEREMQTNKRHHCTALYESSQTA